MIALLVMLSVWLLAPIDLAMEVVTKYIQAGETVVIHMMVTTYQDDLECFPTTVDKCIHLVFESDVTGVRMVIPVNGSDMTGHDQYDSYGEYYFIKEIPTSKHALRDTWRLTSASVAIRNFDHPPEKFGWLNCGTDLPSHPNSLCLSMFPLDRFWWVVDSIYTNQVFLPTMRKS